MAKSRRSMPVDLDRAGLGVVVPAQQLGQRGLAGPVATDNRERRPGGHRQVEVFEDGRPARVGEGEVAEADLAGRGPGGRSGAGGQRARLCHGGLEAQDGGHRRGRAIERETEPTERDQGGADRRLGKDDDLAEAEPAARRVVGERPEHRDVRRHDQEQTPEHGGRSRNRVAAYCSSCSRVRLAMKRSMVHSARPNSRSSLLAGGSTASRYA